MNLHGKVILITASTRGIGLSIVKNILQAHDFEYGVDSEVGKGSTFWFELKITE